MDCLASEHYIPLKARAIGAVQSLDETIDVEYLSSGSSFSDLLNNVGIRLPIRSAVDPGFSAT